MPPKRNTRTAPAPAAAAVAGTGEAPTANPTAAGSAGWRRDREEPVEEQRVVRVRQKVVEESKWSWSSPVRSILLHRFNLEIGKMGLREFVKEYVGIDYPIEQIDNYTMDVVVEELEECVTDGKLRRWIERAEEFQQLRDARQARQQAMKDADLLNERGVVTLFQWKNYDQRGIVSLCSQGVLNGVHVWEAEILQEGKVLAGLYDSVYNAKWGYVVKIPHDDPDIFCFEAKDGSSPPQEWTDGEVDFIPPLGEDEDVRKREVLEDKKNVKSTQELLMMKVLTSLAGWPYGLSSEGKFLDCYITKEVERAWRVVRNDLRVWFIVNPREPKRPRPRILIGTPGIGKSMAAGSYLLYQLLQYDGERLPVVAYFIDRLTYIFDKTTKRATVYNDVKGLAMVRQLARKCKGYTIYDCSAEKVEPPLSLPGSWGTVLISPPSEKHFKNWEKQNTASRFFMNCPEENDIKAMCAWRQRRKPDELHDYWIMIKDRMSHVGPVLRYIFDEGMYTIRSLAAGKALATITPSTAERCYGVYRCKLWLNANPLQTIVKIVRVIDNRGFQTFYNDPICPELRDELRNSLGESIDSSEVLMTLLLPIDALISRALDVFGVKIFAEMNFTLRIHKCLEEIPPPWMRRPQSCVLRDDLFAGPSYQEEIPYEIDSDDRMKLEFERLYKPSNPNFPVVDAFFFAHEPRKTIVGIQTTVSKYCHTTTSKVKALHDHLATLFMDWNEISKDLSWEIIYVRHTARKTKLTWRRCDVVVPKGQKNVKEVKDEHEAIAKHWNEKVHQYQL